MSTSFSSLDIFPAFVAVMRHGSLSAAARVLGVAQPTVRRHIETLEAELAVQLFTRAANGLTPTALAHRLLPSAEAVLSEAAALRRTATETDEGLSGVVRITCTLVVATHVLPPLLVTLRHAAPELTVELAATDSTQDLLRRAADIAIRLAPPSQTALRVQKLPDVAFGLFASPALVPDPQAVTPEDFAALPFLSDDQEGAVLPGLAALGVPTPKHVVLRTDDARAQIAGMEAGLGVGITQVGLARRKGLVRVLPHITHHMPCWLAMHEDQARVPRIRAVFDHLKTGLPALL